MPPSVVDSILLAQQRTADEYRRANRDLDQTTPKTLAIIDGKKVAARVGLCTAFDVPGVGFVAVMVDSLEKMRLVQQVLFAADHLPIQDLDERLVKPAMWVADKKAEGDTPD